jgi:cellulose biosynthesis protein BcsQ
MRISLFNHKGGVSKTTTTFNLGWMLAALGKTVLLVDTDPQCNLTGLVLGQEGGSELAEFYDSNPTRNIRACLAPVFEARPVPLAPVDCITVDDQHRLFLLPGHIGLAEYEVTLGIAQELSGSIQTLQNVPGAIAHLLRVTAERYKAGEGADRDSQQWLAASTGTR